MLNILFPYGGVVGVDLVIANWGVGKGVSNVLKDGGRMGFPRKSGGTTSPLLHSTTS